MESPIATWRKFHHDVETYNAEILDVHTLTKDFLFKRHPLYTFYLIAITVFAATPALVIGTPYLLMPFFIPLIAYDRVRRRLRQTMFDQFAKALGMTYTPFANREHISGYFFEIGEHGSPKNVLSGNYNGVPIRLYEYNFSTESGKDRAHFDFVVSEIDTQKNLPHIFVRSKLLSLGSTSHRPPGTKIMSLEGHFNNRFEVWVPEDGEIDALRVLEPDVMATLIDEFPFSGFECAGTKTYVFKEGSFANNRAALLKQITFMERLYDELIPELEGVARSR